MSWLPIIPLSSFYNLPSGPPISLSELPTASTTQIDPSLMAESLPVGQSAPATPAEPSMDILAPSVPCLKPVLHVSKCKIHEEFSANDIDQLLHALISVNLYLAPHSQITDKWKEVTKLLKQRVHVLGAIMRLSRTRSRVCSLGYRCILFLFLFLFIFIYFRLANNV